MKTKLMFLTIALMFVAMPMFAQGTGAAAGGGGNPWGPLAAGFSMAFASGLCALGMGKAISGAAEGAARNPGAFPAIRFALIFGLALIESLALYTLVIVFVKVAP
jgi:F-type H+-transporting ATPase subunit c